MASHTCLICFNLIDKPICRPLSVCQKIFSTCKKHLHETLTDDWEPSAKNNQLALCDDCFNGSMELAQIVDELEKFQKQVNDVLLVFSLKVLHRRSQISASLEFIPEDRNSIEIDISKLTQHFNLLPKSNSPHATDIDEEEEEITISPNSTQIDKRYPLLDVACLKEEYMYDTICDDEDDSILPGPSENDNLFVYYDNEEVEIDNPENPLIDSTQIVQRSLIEEFFVAEDHHEESPSPTKSEHQAQTDLKVNIERIRGFLSMERLKFGSDGKPIVNDVSRRSKRKAFISAANLMYTNSTLEMDNFENADFADNSEEPEELEPVPPAASNNRRNISVSSLLNIKRKKVPLPKLSSNNIQETPDPVVASKFVRNIKRQKQYDPLSTKSFKCSVCDYSTCHHNYLTVHMRSHTGERPYKCHKCQKSFRQSAHLRVHLLTHSKIKHYKCPVCKKAYSNSSSLKGHIYRHTGEKRFLCPICDYATSESGNLKRHITTHNDTRPYKCASCGILYKSKIAVKKHYASAHPHETFSVDCILHC